MFSKLPELFGRNFATGYFLPIVIFISASLTIVEGTGLIIFPMKLKPTDQIDLLLGTTLIGIFSWLGGFLLLALNRDIIRLMEG